MVRLVWFWPDHFFDDLIIKIAHAKHASITAGPLQKSFLCPFIAMVADWVSQSGGVWEADTYSSPLCATKNVCYLPVYSPMVWRIVLIWRCHMLKLAKSVSSQDRSIHADICFLANVLVQKLHVSAAISDHLNPVCCGKLGEGGCITLTYYS